MYKDIARHRHRHRHDNYDKIEVPDGGIALGEWVLIMNDDRNNWHNEEAHLDGYSGVAVKCVQDGGIIVVYALLAFFFNYGPFVLVKVPQKVSFRTTEGIRSWRMQDIRNSIISASLGGRCHPKKQSRDVRDFLARLVIE